MAATGPYSTEDWQQNGISNTLQASSNAGRWINNKTFEDFERAASIVVELEDYCDKFQVPLPIKELKKMLGRV